MRVCNTCGSTNPAYHLGGVTQCLDEFHVPSLTGKEFKERQDALLKGGKPEQVPFAGGLAASSKIPPLHLIPTIALECLANRFQKGIERKGDNSWNALSTNQSILTDREFAIERTAHAIQHAMKLRDKLLNGEDLPGDDDDAGAIMWAGAFFACVGVALTKEKEAK